MQILFMDQILVRHMVFWKFRLLQIIDIQLKAILAYAGAQQSHQLEHIGKTRPPLSALDLYYGLKATYTGIPYGIPLWE